MFESEELKTLALRKESLVARSEVLRETLRLEGDFLAHSMAGMDRSLAGLKQSRYLWAGAAPVAGFILLRKWRFFFRSARRLIRGWALLRKFLRFFQQLDRVTHIRSALQTAWLRKMGF
jgi:hypothetical protein